MTALLTSTLTAMVRGSKINFSLPIPYFSACARILFAASILPSASVGIPLSSIQSATTYEPYFFAMGKTLAAEDSSAFTEFITHTPFVTRTALSSASFLGVSITSGRSATP